MTIAHRLRYWMTPVLDRLPASLFPVRERAIHAYALGMPRSGTVSVFDCFKNEFRAAHEPESRFLTFRILDYRAGLTGESEMRSYLRQRDRRLGLELDSSYLNADICDLLASEFPQSRFILPMRDCVSWTESMMNFLLNKPEFMSKWLKSHIYRHMAMQFGPPPYSFAPEEKALQEKGLHPLSVYLKYWTEHHRRVIATVPAQRLLVLRTSELGRSARLMEDFLGLPEGRLQQSVHSNAAPRYHGLIGSVPPAFLRDSVYRHCGELMSTHFPEVMARLDAESGQASGDARQ